MSDVRLLTPAQLWEWLQANASGLVVPAGAVLVVVLVVLLRRAIRRGTADAWAVTFATVTALGFSAEGMFEVTREKLPQIPLAVAGLLFFVGESAMLASMMRAHRHFHRVNADTGEPNRTLGKHGMFVWVIALATGFVVSLNGANVVEWCIRLLMPLLAAGMWWMGYADDVTRRAKGAVTWRWHPRRLAIVLGIIEPGEDDIARVHRERQVRTMTALSHKVHTGWSALRGWRTGRLARLALLADDAMVAEVAARVARAHHIVTLTQPVAPVATGPVPGEADSDVTKPPRKTTTSTGMRRQTTAERVAKTAARMPTATTAQIAAKVGVSERTVQRYLRNTDTAPGASVAAGELAGAAL